MVTLDEARRRAMAHISRDFDLRAQADHVVIIDAKTMEAVKGWLFVYNSARFLETGNVGDMLMSNRPVFVDRLTGTAEYASAAVTLDDMLDHYGGAVRPASTAR